MTTDEYLEIVNEKGEIIGKELRSKVHSNPSLLHRVTHVLVFNSRGEVLLQKRSMRKDVAPGRWDTSVGGHVNAGETVEEAVLREMEEELGIKGIMPEFIYSYIHSNNYESELVYSHHCLYEGKIKFNTDEIDEVRYWRLSEIVPSEIFSQNLLHEVSLYREFLKKIKSLQTPLTPSPYIYL